jgi:predicted PurR-regulated permease PerM
MSTRSTTKGEKKSPPAQNVSESTFVERVSKIGILTWSFVGFVIATIFIVTALAAVSEVVLPMVFAAVLAIAFKPLVGYLGRHKIGSGLSAGIIVITLLGLVVWVLAVTVQEFGNQAAQIGAAADAAIESASPKDQATLHMTKNAIKEATPMVTTGVLPGMISLFSNVVAIAAGILFGSLIMYYLLKDGTQMRKTFVAGVDPPFRKGFNDFISDVCGIIRDYGKGRTIMSAMVAFIMGGTALLLGLPFAILIIAVNFLVGYIPYIGAFIGGGLAVVIAYGYGGVPQAVIMLLVILASNIILENLISPKVMGKSLDIHPLVVLVVTALGGLLGGIVGLILAVPAYVIGVNAIGRIRSKGLDKQAADQMRPAIQQMLE